MSEKAQQQVQKELKQKEAAKSNAEILPEAAKKVEEVKAQPSIDSNENSNVNGAPAAAVASNAQAVNGTDSAPRDEPTRRLDEDGEEVQTTTFTPRRSRRYDDPPVIYPDIDGPAHLKRILEIMEGRLARESIKDLNEFMEYLTTDGGAWALGTSHLETISLLLNDRNLPQEVPVVTLKMLQSAALKEDVILLLHQDREQHHLMTYFFKIESLSLEEQAETVGLMCNMCLNPSSYDWLTYISEWEEEGKPCNNSRVTVRVAVHGLLSEHPATRDRGCALVFNLALKKELFDDIATELAMAVMQFLQTPPCEELLFQALTALLRFIIISYNEIPALMKMLGPDVDAFKGVSARIDPVVEEIQLKLRVAR